MRYTHLKCIIWWVLMEVYTCETMVPCEVQNIFIIPKGFFLPLCSTYFCYTQLQVITDLLSIIMDSLPFPELQVNEIIQYAVFCVWVLSLSIMILRATHVVAYISSQFLSITEQQFIVVWRDHILIIHSPVDGHLGTFQFWATMNNSVMNIFV